MKSVACLFCKAICVVRDDQQIYISDEGLICQACLGKANHCSALSVAERIVLKEEILSAMCHPEQVAYFALLPNFYLICLECKKVIDENILCLNLSSPRFTLVNKLSVEYQMTSEITILSRWRKRLQVNQKISDIYKNLVESYFFSSYYPVCCTHLHESLFYDIASLEFKCQYCGPTESKCYFSNAEHYSFIVQVSLQILQNLPTSAFNPILIKAAQAKSFDKNSLFLMKDAIEEKNNFKISIGMVCLYCCKPFGYKLKQPMQLHSNKLHEICLECFIKNTLTSCYLDNNPIINEFRPIMQDFLEKPLKRCHEHTNLVFCIRNNKLPYKFCCIENLCQDCFENLTKSEEIECTKCRIKMNKKFMVLNEHLKELIEYFELYCELHSEPISHMNKSNGSVYCKNCPELKFRKGHPQSLSDDQYAFRGLLLKFIEPYLENHQEIFIPALINKYSFFFSLECIYEVFQNLKQAFGDQTENGAEQVERTIFESLPRFRNILPVNMNRIQKWSIRKNYRETIKIKTDGLLELFGIIIGNCDDGELEASIYCSGYQMGTARVPIKSSSEDAFSYLFPKPILIQNTWTEIGVAFNGPADYICHGMPSKRISPLIYKNLEIFIDSDHFDNGNNIIGGPIIGFILSKITVSKSDYETCQQMEKKNLPIKYSK